MQRISCNVFILFKKRQEIKAVEKKTKPRDLSAKGGRTWMQIVVDKSNPKGPMGACHLTWTR